MSVVVEKLSKHYGAQKALDEVSFTARKGEIVGLLGPNGCLLYTSDAADE